MTLTINEDAQTAAAKLDGCYVLKTDLTPAQAPKEIVHDRYKSGICRARVSYLQNRAPRSAPHLLTP